MDIHWIPQILILLMSVVIHEVSHGYMADYLGDPTPRMKGRLTLNPLKHLDWFGSVLLPLILVVINSPFIIGWAKPVPFNPLNITDRRFGSAKVALAGPLSNIALAVIFGLVIRFIELDPVMGSIASFIVFINLLLALFNLLPVPPLDGHHILFALLGSKGQRFQAFLRQYSLFVLMFVLFFAWDIIMPVLVLLYTLITGQPL